MVKLRWLLLAVPFLAAASFVPGGVQTAPGTLAPSGITTTSVPPSGSGADSSANAPTALANLSTFTVTNPGAYRVQNQSAATIQVQMCVSAGVNCSIVLLGPGAGANAQGGDTSPELPWFTGLINVLGPTGSQFFARHN